MGLPGCLVATTEFAEAAAAQARTLGLEPAIVWVDHPIQNRSPEELEVIADAAIDGILGMLADSYPPTTSTRD